MPLQRQSTTISFQHGIDTKIDPILLPVGLLTERENLTFTKIGKLVLRNGFPYLNTLPDATSNYATTFQGALVAIGRDLKVLSEQSQLWTSKGYYRQCQFSQNPIVRTGLQQTYADVAVSTQGTSCVAFIDNEVVGSSTVQVPKYSVFDSSTGQSIVPPVKIVSSQGNATYSPRAFCLGNNFIVAFTVSSASTNRLQYIAVPAASPSLPLPATDLNTTFDPSSKMNWDGVVNQSTMYFAWNASGIKATTLQSTLQQGQTVAIASAGADILTMTSDNTQGQAIIWVSGYSIASASAVVVATNSASGSASALSTLFSARSVSLTPEVTNLTMAAKYLTCSVFYEHKNDLTFGSALASNHIGRADVGIQGSITVLGHVIRGSGLATKAFIVGSETFVGVNYQSDTQSTNFIINSLGGIIAKFNYGNGLGYSRVGLPNVYTNGLNASFPYLTKTIIQSVNKGTAVGSATPTNAIYTQSGINLGRLNYETGKITTAEVANNLNISGGMLWAYDGFQTTEHGFHLYPDNVVISSSTATGSISAGVYYYRVTYETTDGQGNVIRSAPSIPVVCTFGSGTSNMVNLNVPTLKHTYRVSNNPVKIVAYRWSVAQQTYYQITSVTTPVISSTTIDAVVITDKAPDSLIFGNNILYTTGNVVENIEPPPVKAMTIFDSRLWTISAENPDILLYSKQIVPSSPVEMSDLFSFYVSPTAAAQGPTGPITSIAPLDDKLIIFKKNAVYYITGKGPDDTGNNSQYSEPVFITSTVGCERPNSIVTIPMGLMFQSDKGIWILNRSLQTEYIGKEVEAYNDATVTSAVAVPGTNEVRFSLDTGVMLVYDYFVGKWGTYNGIANVSGTIYNSKHTIVNAQGRVLQETPGVYVDGSSPTLWSFKTGWVSLAGIQGFVKNYEMYILGHFVSPHFITVGIAYDYADGITQQTTIVPDNFSGVWGSSSNWGSVLYWGGPSSKEQWRINFKKKSGQAVQIKMQSFYNPAYGIPNGGQVEISALTFVYGVIHPWAQRIKPSNRTG